MDEYSVMQVHSSISHWNSVHKQFFSCACMHMQVHKHTQTCTQSYNLFFTEIMLLLDLSASAQLCTAQENIDLLTRETT